MAEEHAPLILRKDGEVVWIEFNRPERKNALNFECWNLLGQYLNGLEEDSGSRILVITGRDQGIFSAGVDINPSDPFIVDMFHAFQNQNKERLKEGFAFIQHVISKLADLSIPTIAAINGLCYSGALELALACDIRLVVEDAELCFQETRLGLIPDLGGSVRLARLVGTGRAKELIFSARKMSPGEARKLGLVHHVFPGDRFEREVLKYIGRILSNSPSALRAVKKIINSTTDMEMAEALAFEREQAADNVLSGDCIEGIGAFLEKRKPRWSG